MNSLNKTTACSAVLAAGITISPVVATPAAGEESAFVARQLENVARDMHRSVVLGGLHRMREALATLPREYCESNWNGYDEDPLSVLSWNNANRFMSYLPDSIEEAEVGVSADGEVVLEWFYDRDRQCSVTFGRNGSVYFISRLPGKRASITYGTAYYGEIAKLIGQVTNV